MKIKTLFVFSYIVLTSNFSFGHNPTEYMKCMVDAKNVVKTVASISFNLPPRTPFKPRLRGVTFEDNNQVGFLVDMQKDDGTILNADQGGSSAYLVKITPSYNYQGVLKNCFVNSVEFTNEP